MPVQDQQQHRRAAGQRQDHAGQQFLQVPHPVVQRRTRQPGRRWCARRARRRTPGRARPRRARTAARTAASPAPRSGSLTPGAASLTAESTQASLSRWRPSSDRREVPAAAELGCQPAGQPYRRVESSGAGVGVGEPVRGHTRPRLLDVGQRGAGGSAERPDPRFACPATRARERGAERARQRRQPPGQPGGQQIRAVGQAGGPAPREQFVGAGEQRLAVGPAARVAEQVQR